jgi:hypothetical protein
MRHAGAIPPNHNLLTDEGRLARHTLPHAILLSPDISKTTRAHKPFAFFFYLILVYSSGNRDIPL